jgi:hypothetical protein
MSITIRRPTTPTLTQGLGQNGTLHIFVPAEVEVEAAGRRTRDEPAIALRWESAPNNARLTQQLSLRAAWTTSSASYVPVEPAPPFTDAVVPAYRRDLRSGLAAHFPLSPFEERRTCSVDAAPTSDLRCPPSRGYVSDSSYGFVERTDATLVFYDAPTLGLNDPSEALRRARIDRSLVTGYELVVLFHTELLRGSTRLGAVLWSCSWRHTATRTGIFSEGFRRFDAPLHAGRLVEYHTHPPEGPTPVERRQMLFRWRDRGAQRCPTHRPLRPLGNP